MLFARFVGCDQTTGKESRPTTHLVILDDTPSMDDGWRREDNGAGSAFAEGKRLVYEKLMPAAAQATTAQTLHLIRVSEPDAPFPAGTKTVKENGADKEVERSADEIRDAARVNADNIALMDQHLRNMQPATVRRTLGAALRKAKVLLDQRSGGNTAQIIHIVSDLRAGDWATDGAAVSELLKEFKENGVTVHLMDVAHPRASRTGSRRSSPTTSPSWNSSRSTASCRWGSRPTSRCGSRTSAAPT